MSEQEQLPSDDLPPDTHPIEDTSASDLPVDIAMPAPAPAPAAIPTAATPPANLTDHEGNVIKDAKGNPVPADSPLNYKPNPIPTGANPRVLEMGPVFRPIVHEEDRDTPFHVAALPCDGETFNSLVDAYPSINYGHGLASREWSAEVNLAEPLLPQANFLSRAMSREGSLWGQRVPYGAGTLGPSRPQLNRNSGPGVKISGDVATGRFMQVLGAGSPITLPLYHSGFWVSLRAPTLAARLELQRRIDAEKIDLGRRTNGLAYSNMSVYINSFLVDFAMAHVTQANVRYSDVRELKELIQVQDIPALVWGMLAAMYPGGYPYHQPCVNDPLTCQHVVKAILDINKMYVVDTHALTETQLRHLADRTTRWERKDLQAYRDQHRYVSMGKIEAKSRTGSITVTLKAPTAAEYFSAGFAWVDGIVADVTRAFGQDLTGERRNQYILERAQLTNMCEYSHWVKEMALPDGAVTEDVETIRTVLAGISGDPDMKDAFFKQVGEFMEDCSIGAVVLPRYDCPSCGRKPSEEEQKYPYVSPIDVESLFFITAGQHIEKAGL